MKRLNIGCGRDYREGWVNIDISTNTKTDMTADIGYGLPDVKDCEASEIYISGVLEQVGPNHQFIMAMNECHRVLKPGGIMTVVVPNAKYSIAHRDPMDVRKFTKETFDYFLADNRAYKLYGSVYGFLGWSAITIQENERHILTIEMIK